MKKSHQILCAALAAAALVPYRRTADGDGGATIQALLWRASLSQKENGRRSLTLSLGLFPPSLRREEQLLFDDEALWGKAGRSQGPAPSPFETSDETSPV